MKQVIIAGLIAVAFFACNNNEVKSTEKNNESSLLVEEGYTSLFDGKTMAGWHNYGKTTIGDAWKVVDGAMTLDTTVRDSTFQIKGGGDIVTDKEYKNFDLKLEWKIAPGGNSGIIFNSHEDTAKYRWGWMTGPEMQILDDSAHADSKIDKHRAGDLYDLISCSQPAVKKAGEWNQVQITSNKGKLDFYLNGVSVVSTTMFDDNWKKLIAGSKFKAWADFGTYKKGHICLQDHGNAVWFRNIRIKEL
jgi:hypothetical protein